MPSRAYTSFLRVNRPVSVLSIDNVSMPSRAYTSFLHMGRNLIARLGEESSVNALSGLYLISTCDTSTFSTSLFFVSMPSRAYTSFLRKQKYTKRSFIPQCQCPLGLIPHFYLVSPPHQKGRKEISVNALSGLYLISTERKEDLYGKEILWCQCPLGLIPHFYEWVYEYPETVNSDVSMPSRAYTSFLPSAVCS